MDTKIVKELVNMMKANDLSELEIVDGEMRIMLKRGPSEQAAPQIISVPANPTVATSPAVQPATVAPPTAPTTASPPAEEENLLKIPSPIVGTFYSSPSPNADPFVSEGSKISSDSIVCIIEAMKVMNEIKSEVNGTVKKVLVKNGQAVEYGQTLFLVEPE